MINQLSMFYNSATDHSQPVYIRNIYSTNLTACLGTLNRNIISFSHSTNQSSIAQLGASLRENSHVSLILFFWYIFLDTFCLTCIKHYCKPFGNRCSMLGILLAKQGKVKTIKILLVVTTTLLVLGVIVLQLT